MNSPQKSVDLVQQADSAFSGADYPRTAELCRQALYLDPENVQATVLGGFSAAQLGQTQVAIEHLRRAVERDLNLWGPRTALASLYMMRGNLKDAVRYWK